MDISYGLEKVKKIRLDIMNLLAQRKSPCELVMSQYEPVI